METVKKVLYIEDGDTEDLCTSIRIGIKDVDICIVTTATEAIEKLKENVFDVIICDGTLRKETHGRQVITFIMQNQPENLPKLVVYSGEQAFIDECKNQGISSYIKDSMFSNPQESIAPLLGIKYASVWDAIQEYNKI